MLPPDEKPKPAPLKMSMQGKIVKKDKCRFCDGSYVVLIPEGETEQRIFHSKEPCDQFKDVNTYWRWHNMSRDQRRAAMSKKNGHAASRRRR